MQMRDWVVRMLAACRCQGRGLSNKSAGRGQAGSSSPFPQARSSIPEFMLTWQPRLPVSGQLGDVGVEELEDVTCAHSCAGAGHHVPQLLVLKGGEGKQGQKLRGVW